MIKRTYLRPPLFTSMNWEERVRDSMEPNTSHLTSGTESIRLDIQYETFILPALPKLTTRPRRGRHLRGLGHGMRR